MLLQLLAQHALFEIIGEQILHAAKAGSLGRSKPVEEWHFVKEHGQIGGEFRHPQMSSRVPLTALIDPDWSAFRRAEACLQTPAADVGVYRQSARREHPRTRQ